jgi:hypothetical protein
MPIKGTTTGADLVEEVKKVLQSLDIPVQKLTGLATDRAQAQ